jgi:hypothetical protein
MIRPLIVALLAAGCAPGRVPRDEPRANAGEGCVDSDCHAWDSSCSRGACDEDGVCVALPAREGEPCARGSRCGESRCDAGRCVMVEPLDCSDLDDDCHVGACTDAVGCVAVPKPAPGLDCEHPASVHPVRAPLVEVDDGCAPDRSAFGAVGLPERRAVFFGVDLSSLEEPAPVSFLLGAEAELESALLQGDCGDPFVVARGKADPALSHAGESSIEQVLERGYYTLVAANAAQGAAGAIELAVRVDSGPQASPASDSRCADPIQLDRGFGVDVRLGRLAESDGGLADPCGDRYFKVEACYELDLSASDGDTLARFQFSQASGRLFSTDADGGCRAFVVDGDAFSAVLAPGRYLVAVDAYVQGLYSLRAETMDASLCGDVPNDSCATAVDLDSDLPLQRISGDTACGLADPSQPFNERQLFYRLDLRGFDGPVLLGSSPDLASVVVFESAADGGCARETNCCGALLAPRVYYLAVRSLPSPFDFELSLTPAPPPGPADCIPREVIRCAVNSVAACEYGLRAAECVDVLDECGLEWVPLTDLCANAPECCDASLSGADPASCEAAFLEAGARCEPCAGDYCWF